MTFRNAGGQAPPLAAEMLRIREDSLAAYQVADSDAAAQPGWLPASGRQGCKTSQAFLYSGPRCGPWRDPRATPDE